MASMGDRIEFAGPVHIERMDVYSGGGPMERDERTEASETGNGIDLDHLIRCAESIEALGEIIAEIGDNPRGEALTRNAERIGWMIAEYARPISAFLRGHYPALLGAVADGAPTDAARLPDATVP